MDLKTLLDDHQLYHSEFQQDYLITGKTGGTIYGQYKQALRELYKRTRGLRELFCNRERLEIDIDEAKFKMENEKDEFKQRRAEVDFKEKTMLTEESDRVIKDTKREFLRFYRQAKYYKSLIGELTDETRKKLDEEMWEYKLKEMIIVDLNTMGRVSNNTYEFLHATPKTMRLRIMNDMKDQNRLIDWYENHREETVPENFPEVESIDFDAVNLLEG